MCSKTRLSFSGSFFLILSCALLLLPLRWIFAWCLAVAVHEMGHYIALRTFRIRVDSVSFSAHGIRMETGYLPAGVELLCAISGPAAGFCLLFLSKYLPYTAFCAFLHGVFNLLPIHPMDGGRVLRVLLMGLLKNENNVYRAERGICTVFFIGLLLFAVVFHLGIGAIVGILLFFAQNILANRGKKLYNREKIYL